jgi:aspartyl-tRNA(Asn)/glutamyl-tRNA(Gln) amidotransferase subunit B
LNGNRLEVQRGIKTASKAFCAAPRFGGEPNYPRCPVCLGVARVLPVINRQVVVFGMKTALALNALPGGTPFL